MAVYATQVARVLDEVFAIFGKAIDYCPAEDETRQLMAIIKQPDIISEFGESRILSSSLIIEIRKAEAPIIQAGDGFIIDGITYQIQGEAISHDPDNLIWRLELLCA